MSQDSLKKVYTCYPATLFYSVIKMNTRVEGVIEVAPYGQLKDIKVSIADEGVLLVAPGDNSVDTSGEIRIYLNEKAILETADKTEETQDDTEQEENE